MSVYYNDISDPLAAIYNEKYWRVNNVSLLRNLQLSAVKLKQYASKIRQDIANKVPANSTIKYTVTLEVNPYLKYSEDDSEGLMITVSSSQENLASRVVYKSILLSWGLSNKLRGAVHLPYMLEHGWKKIGTAVKNSLRTLFDCNIYQYRFTQLQLLRFGFNFIQNEASCISDPVKFCFRMQEHKSEVIVKFEIGDVFVIWNGTKEELSEISQRVLSAYIILHNQIFYSFLIDVEPLDLYKITLFKAEVNADGTIKMKTPEIVNSVFTVLNEISNIIVDI